ncbi:MAG TPA: hypothetical protein DHV59_08270 [Oxalobacteraceae bacterium]|nr:hypothetical protein [Oxalobacteraceae bacterium]
MHEVQQVRVNFRLRGEAGIMQEAGRSRLAASGLIIVGLVLQLPYGTQVDLEFDANMQRGKGEGTMRGTK